MRSLCFKEHTIWMWKVAQTFLKNVAWRTKTVYRVYIRVKTLIRALIKNFHRDVDTLKCLLSIQSQCLGSEHWCLRLNFKRLSRMDLFLCWVYLLEAIVQLRTWHLARKWLQKFQTNRTPSHRGGTRGHANSVKGKNVEQDYMLRKMW